MRLLCPATSKTCSQKIASFYFFGHQCHATLCLAPLRLYALSGKTTLLLRTMDIQLEEVRHRACKVEDSIKDVQQDLATARQAKDKVQERVHSELLLDYNKQLLSLQDKENILLHGQPSCKPCLQLVMTGFLCSHHVASHSVNRKFRQISMFWIHILVQLHQLRKTFFDCDTMELYTCRVLTWRHGCTSCSQKMG